MKVTSSFDFDVVALQEEDTLTALIAFEAPISESDAARPGECLIPILDTSGSMEVVGSTPASRRCTRWLIA